MSYWDKEIAMGGAAGKCEVTCDGFCGRLR